MKRKVLILLVLVVALFTVACSKNAEDTVAGTQEESNVEASENAPSTEEKEEEKAEEKEEDKEEEKEEDKLVESLQWPADFMENVPVLEGEIFKVREDEENKVHIGLKSISHEDSLAYIEKLKEAGFTKDVAEYIADSNINFKASDKNGNFVKLRWSISGDAGIDMVKPEK